MEPYIASGTASTWKILPFYFIGDFHMVTGSYTSIEIPHIYIWPSG